MSKGKHENLKGRSPGIWLVDGEGGTQAGAEQHQNSSSTGKYDNKTEEITRPRPPTLIVESHSIVGQKGQS
jgi:hypothetical protein